MFGEKRSTVLIDITVKILKSRKRCGRRRAIDII